VKRSARDRFLAMVDRAGPTPVERPELGPCWPWRGYVRPNGYGRFMVAAGKPAYAHRYSYELAVERIPASMDLDHLCRRRDCVNPHHLEPVSRRENLRRSPVVMATRAVCKLGHVKRKRPNGKVVCPTCKAMSDRQYNHTPYARARAVARARIYRKGKQQCQ
jgi:hypothetical protein